MKRKKPENITPVTRFSVAMRALMNDYSRKAHSESIKRGIRAERMRKMVADAKIN